MALTLVTNPVGSDSVKIFAGFQPVDFIFKREDLQITSVESGSGGVKINVTSDLTSYLSLGDPLYLYSAGANYTYNDTGLILSITATDITIDVPFIEAATGGYINYFKNYYVEVQCVDKVFATSNLLPFSLKSDGDRAGNITVDVSIVNDLNSQRGDIASGFLSDSSIEFHVQYRQVYSGSGESFTLLNTKLVVLSYATETPENDTILNNFDIPNLYLGYQSALVISNIEDAASSTLQLTYRELGINKDFIADGLLDELDSDVNGFLLWEWANDITVNNATQYIEFDTNEVSLVQYDPDEYESTDYITT